MDSLFKTMREYVLDAEDYFFGEEERKRRRFKQQEERWRKYEKEHIEYLIEEISERRERARRAYMDDKEEPKEEPLPSEEQFLKEKFALTGEEKYIELLEEIQAIEKPKPEIIEDMDERLYKFYMELRDDLQDSYLFRYYPEVLDILRTFRKRREQRRKKERN